MFQQQKFLERGLSSDVSEVGESSRNKCVLLLGKLSLHFHPLGFTHKLLVPRCWSCSVLAWPAWAAAGNGA